jgi:hypothetical protein
MKIPDNTAENPQDPKPADARDVQTEYFSDYFCSPSTGVVTQLAVRTSVRIDTV